MGQRPLSPSGGEGRGEGEFYPPYESLLRLDRPLTLTLAPKRGEGNFNSAWI